MKRSIGCEFVVGFLLLGLSQNVFASSYRVEVLVFAHNQPTSEVFEQTLSTLKPPMEAVEITPSSDLLRFSFVEEPLNGLSSAYTQLITQPNYKLLFKKAWLAVNVDNQSMPAAHIQNSDGSLNGYVSLMTNGAMTMQVDLEYRSAKQNSYSEVMGASPLVYRLTEKRPLKFNESHYFDHPMVGIVMLVTPL